MNSFLPEPKSLEEVIGNDDAKQLVRTWALDWQRGKRGKALLLAGAPGVGKTAMVHALASEMQWNLIESNASDLRNADNFKKLMGLSTGSRGLFGEQRLLFIDEVDSAFDRGEIPAVMQLVRENSSPVILCANNAWEPKITSLRMECLVIQLKKVNSLTIRKYLMKLAQERSIPLQLEEADAISKASRGDVRAGMIDLLTFEGKQAGEREREENVFEVVRKIFKTTSFKEAMDASSSSEVELDLLVKWVEENIPAEYERKEDVARAFDNLSKADVFAGRIRKRQDYSLQKYLRVLSFAGVSLSKEEPYHKFTMYQFPSIVKRLGESKKTREMLKGIAGKVGKETHSSISESMKAIPFLDEESFGYYGFSEDEKSFLLDLHGFEEDKKKKRGGKNVKQPALQLV